MVIGVLAVLAFVAAVNVLAPAGEAGKRPRTLTPGVAAVATVLFCVEIAGMVYVGAAEDYGPAPWIAGTVAGLWGLFLIFTVASVGKVRERPTSTGATLTLVALNTAILAAVLFLLTKAV